VPRRGWQDLEEEEASVAAQEAQMRDEGHAWLGRRVARYFDRPAPALGTLTLWLPPSWWTVPSVLVWTAPRAALGTN
jgi:hypothetical protein